jgi:hypothetical protein
VTMLPPTDTDATSTEVVVACCEGHTCAACMADKVKGRPYDDADADRPGSVLDRAQLRGRIRMRGRLAEAQRRARRRQEKASRRANR